MVFAAVCTIALLVAAFGVRHFVAAPFRVPGESMAPTVLAGDVVLVDRSTRGTAERGHVVVVDAHGYFSSPSNERFWVKRVIGVEGDRIECCADSGALLVNGEELAEPYLSAGMAASAVEFSVEVPEGRLFLLGDNREVSNDSRAFLGAPGGGMVPVEKVQGEVTAVVWPPSRARRM